LSHLVLFDIDGTLVRRAGPQHGQALVEAVHRVTGRRVSIEGIPVYGMLDGDILREMMGSAGFSSRQTRAAMPAIHAVASRLYLERCPDLTARVIPGVRGLLRRLARRRVPCGLVTGNLSRIGWHKVHRARLRHHFRFGAFADMGPTRTELARLALAEARRRGWLRNGVRPILIGDTANDIEAAKANGIVSVAVATGHYGVDELRPHAPDVLVTSLAELDWERL
jgi:phosphoglycolate phosphatase-like HAD superfamily hydrolase